MGVLEIVLVVILGLLLIHQTGAELCNKLEEC